MRFTTKTKHFIAHASPRTVWSLSLSPNEIESVSRALRKTTGPFHKTLNSRTDFCISLGNPYTASYIKEIVVPFFFFIKSQISDTVLLLPFWKLDYDTQFLVKWCTENLCETSSKRFIIVHLSSGARPHAGTGRSDSFHSRFCDLLCFASCSALLVWKRRCRSSRTALHTAYHVGRRETASKTSRPVSSTSRS